MSFSTSRITTRSILGNYRVVARRHDHSGRFFRSRCRNNSFLLVAKQKLSGDRGRNRYSWSYSPGIGVSREPHRWRDLRVGYRPGLGGRVPVRDVLHRHPVALYKVSRIYRSFPFCFTCEEIHTVLRDFFWDTSCSGMACSGCLRAIFVTTTPTGSASGRLSTSTC